MSSSHDVANVSDSSARAMRRKAAGARRQSGWLTIRQPIPRGRVLVLGVSAWILFIALWWGAVFVHLASPLLLPSPDRVVASLQRLIVHNGFLWDIGISITRILVSFAIACAIAIPLGICMGTFGTVEAFFNPFVSAWRYLPAPSFIPLLLMWFGTGEGSKLSLLIIGVIFFLITLIMDHTRAVRMELLETSMTLGGSRSQILWTVVVPAVMPDVVTSMRQMLAVSWTYLVIAEIMAPTTGIGAMMMRAKRFLETPDILAGIAVIGLLGLLFDIGFRRLHRALFGYLY